MIQFFFVGQVTINPVYGQAISFHASEPRHLPFCKLVDCRIKAIEHVVVGYFSYYVLGNPFVFKAVVY